MMRKIFLILFSVCVLNAVAQAEYYPVYNYGTFVANPITLEGVQGNNYTLHNSGGYETTISQEQKRSGKWSFRIDCSSKPSGQCLFETANLVNVADMSKNALLVELYIKGFENKPDSLDFHAIFLDKNNSVLSKPSNFKLTMEAADSDGWHRVWGVIPPHQYDKIRFGVSYNKSGVDGLQYLYVDDISARYIPIYITGADVVSIDNKVDLRNIELLGYDIDGNSYGIYATDLIKYTVLQQSGTISGHYLMGSIGEVIRLEANFFGLKTELDVKFQRPVNYSITTEQFIEGQPIHKVFFENPTSDRISASLIVCLLDGEILSDMWTFNKVIAANTEDTIFSEGVKVPFYTKDPVFKAYVVWTNKK